MAPQFGEAVFVGGRGGRSLRECGGKGQEAACSEGVALPLSSLAQPCPPRPLRPDLEPVTRPLPRFPRSPSWLPRVRPSRPAPTGAVCGACLSGIAVKAEGDGERTRAVRTPVFRTRETLPFPFATLQRGVFPQRSQI